MQTALANARTAPALPAALDLARAYVAGQESDISNPVGAAYRLDRFSRYLGPYLPQLDLPALVALVLGACVEAERWSTDPDGLWSEAIGRAQVLLAAVDVAIEETGERRLRA